MGADECQDNARNECGAEDSKLRHLERSKAGFNHHLGQTAVCSKQQGRPEGIDVAHSV